MTYVSHEELVREEVELLPARETLAILNWATVYATNTALALNAGSWHSWAGAEANQAVYVSQH